MLATLKGYKTLSLATLVFLAGLADVVGVVDLQAILLVLGVPQDKVAGVVSLVGLAFGVLRFLTTTPALQGDKGEG